MSRLIDADEIRIKPDFIFYGVCGTPVIRCEDLARIINDMPTIEPQWIPIFERLPEEGTEVLGTDRNGCIRHVYKDKTGLYEFATVEEGMHIGIVAWMPLPEPYKENKE